MSNSATHGWMRYALVFMFDELSDGDVRAAIQSESALCRLRERIHAALAAFPEGGQLPTGDRGDNLLLALLALRSKFERSVALEKLEVNIAMRSGRDGRSLEDSSR